MNDLTIKRTIKMSGTFIIVKCFEISYDFSNAANIYLFLK